MTNISAAQLTATVLDAAHWSSTWQQLDSFSCCLQTDCRKDLSLSSLPSLAEPWHNALTSLTNQLLSTGFDCGAALLTDPPSDAVVAESSLLPACWDACQASLSGFDLIRSDHLILALWCWHVAFVPVFEDACTLLVEAAAGHSCFYVLLALLQCGHKCPTWKATHQPLSWLVILMQQKRGLNVSLSLFSRPCLRA